MPISEQEPPNYTVTINTKSTNLALTTLFNIAVECYSEGYSFSEDLSKMFVNFNDKHNAQDFLFIIQLHPRKQAIPDKAKPLTKSKTITQRKSSKK